MGFIDNIKESLGENIPSEPLYRAVLFGESCAYIENVKSIVSYSQDKVSLLIKNGTLDILGERLYIKKYCGKDIIICGKIISVAKK